MARQPACLFQICLSQKEAGGHFPIDGYADSCTLKSYSVAEHPDDEIQQLRRESSIPNRKAPPDCLPLLLPRTNPFPVISTEMGLPEGTVKWHLE